MERELWLRIKSLLAKQRDRRPLKCTFTNADIVLTFFWAVLHDRPIYWACDRKNWPVYDRRRPLPVPSTMTRRLRTRSVQALIDQMESSLRECFPDTTLHVVDGKPLPISGHSTDPDAGFGRAAGGMAKGYKLHLIYAENGNINAWDVKPMHVDERRVARDLIPRAKIEGYLLADANYDSNHLYDLAADHRIQLLAPKRNRESADLGHRTHSPARISSLYLLGQEKTGWARRLFARRPDIERFFGSLSSASYGLTYLPPWVRRIDRVRRWVQAKLIVYQIAQIRRKLSA